MKKHIRILILLLGALAMFSCTFSSSAVLKNTDIKSKDAIKERYAASISSALTSKESTTEQKGSTLSLAEEPITKSQKSLNPTTYALSNVESAPLDDVYVYNSEEILQSEPEQREKTFAELDEEVNNYDAYIYSKQEKEYIARVVYAEARGEAFEGQVAVASVVLNRFESGKFGSSVKRVVFARSQFAVSKRYSDQTMKAVEEAISNRSVFPNNMFYFQASKRKTWRNFEYYKRIGGHSFYCAAK